MFKKILVPTDASEYSRHALEKAIGLAKAFAAEIELIHVVYTPQDFWGYTLTYGITIDQDELLRNGDVALQSTLEGIDTTGVNITKKVEAGHPATIVINEVKKENIDLIVMGSHGYGPISGPVLGSVSQRVLHRVECPVMIVK